MTSTAAAAGLPQDNHSGPHGKRTDLYGKRTDLHGKHTDPHCKCYSRLCRTTLFNCCSCYHLDYD